MKPLLEHLKFLANYLHKEDKQLIISMFLLDLGFPKGRYVFPYIKDAVFFFFIRPMQLLSCELYPKVARCQGKGCTGEQVEVAIRREVKSRWLIRDPEKWYFYFQDQLTQRPNGPSNLEFFTGMSYVLKAWERCCSEVTQSSEEQMATEENEKAFS